MQDWTSDFSALRHVCSSYHQWEKYGISHWRQLFSNETLSSCVEIDSNPDDFTYDEMLRVTALMGAEKWARNRQVVYDGLLWYHWIYANRPIVPNRYSGIVGVSLRCLILTWVHCATAAAYWVFHSCKYRATSISFLLTYWFIRVFKQPVFLKTNDVTPVLVGKSL